jgi:hypothetical protein
VPSLLGNNCTPSRETHDRVPDPSLRVRWWPLWIALALWLSRRRWLTGLYLAVSSAAMVGVSWLFLTGGWAG